MDAARDRNRQAGQQEQQDRHNLPSFDDQTPRMHDRGVSQTCRFDGESDGVVRSLNEKSKRCASLINRHLVSLS